MNTSKSTRIIAAALAVGLAFTGYLVKHNAAAASDNATVTVSLHSKIPYSFLVPTALKNEVKVTTLQDDSYMKSLRGAGVAAVVQLQFIPGQQLDNSMIANIFFMPEKVFDASTNANEPPVYGTELRRADGYVLSVITSFDMPYEPNSQVAKDFSSLVTAAGNASSYQA